MEQGAFALEKMGFDNHVKTRWSDMAGGNEWFPRRVREDHPAACRENRSTARITSIVTAETNMQMTLFPSWQDVVSGFNAGQIRTRYGVLRRC